MSKPLADKIDPAFSLENRINEVMQLIQHTLKSEYQVYRVKGKGTFELPYVFLDLEEEKMTLNEVTPVVRREAMRTGERKYFVFNGRLEWVDYRPELISNPEMESPPELEG